MRNKLLGLASLVMAMPVNPEMGRNMPVSRLQEFKPYANKLCKSCKNINKESGFCTCTGRYKKLKSKACKSYKSKNK